MQKLKLGFEESLEKNVVSTNQCVSCATCVVACPYKCLDYDELQPRLVKKCEDCGICPQLCPKYDWSWPKVEEFVFKRQKKENEAFGIYRRLVLAQATDKRILERCQDGGAVTAILTYSLQNSIVEGVALSGVETGRPLSPEPKLATTPNELLEHAGTRYSYSPNMLALQEGLKERKETLAFVGTPCQIHAIRKIQMLPLKKYAKRLGFTVGLMCTESFDYSGLFESHIKENMGIDLNQIKKVNIKGKILISLESGEVKSLSLSEAKQYARKSCNYCSDFSAELADISAGGLGLSGWTFIIVRTEKGEEILTGARRAKMIRTKDANTEPFAMSLLTKLSKKKKRKHS